MVILLIDFKMLVKMIDSVGQNGNLNLGRARVSLMKLVLLNDFLFSCFVHKYGTSL